jgi:hypothetical protein
VGLMVKKYSFNNFCELNATIDNSFGSGNHPSFLKNQKGIRRVKKTNEFPIDLEPYREKIMGELNGI